MIDYEKVERFGIGVYVFFFFSIFALFILIVEFNT